MTFNYLVEAALMEGAYKTYCTRFGPISRRAFLGPPDRGFKEVKEAKRAELERDLARKAHLRWEAERRDK